jgi:nucleoside 2-deoxyribosyltransferase
MHIVGGIYRERSIFPGNDVIFGSGGRAAAVLSNLISGITLSSFVGRLHENEINYLVQNEWKVHLESYSVEELTSFTYYHGLSTPIIYPTQLPLSNAPKIHVKDKVILQFGMLEGSAQVEGERVIFDPQNPENPEFFDTEGSTASELAYVLNRREACRLTGKQLLEDAVNSLLERPNVSVVVIKSGTDGAKVFTKTNSNIIYSYRTNLVWPVGSGDVFAAVFAYFWGVEQISAFEAAEFASRGAALYCGKRQLPLQRKDIIAEEFLYQRLVSNRCPNEAKIYLAGPFFTMSQLWLVEEARSAFISSGFKVFSPFHDVGIGDAEEVVPADLKGIEESNVLFALCDGLDSGTLFEVGYAVKHGIKVVAFSEQTSDESMKMLRGSGCEVFRDFTSAVYHAQWAALA